MTTTYAKTPVLGLCATLHKHFGTIWAYHLIDKLEYWFSRPKFQNSFYKFGAPCQKSQPVYRESDSWTEDLGISRKVFNKTFDLIGIRYHSETAFRAEVDPFKGKLYARYHNRQTHQTHYVRNHALVQEFLTGLKPLQHKTLDPAASSAATPPPQTFDQPPPVQPEVQDRALPEVLQPPESLSLTEPQLDEAIISSNNPKGHSQSGPKGPSISIHPSTPNLSSSHSPTNKIVQTVQTETEQEVKKMVILWQEVVETTSYIPRLSQPFINKMKKMLVGLFDNCLDKWQAYCHKITTSKFLMGEKEGTWFKPWFTWAIKAENIQRILQDGYSFGDRQPAIDSATEQQQRQQVQAHIDQKAGVHTQQFHHYLLQQSDMTTYSNWLQELALSVESSGQVLIQTTSKFRRDTLQNRFGRLLEAALQHTFGRNPAYQLVY